MKPAVGAQRRVAYAGRADTALGPMLLAASGGKIVGIKFARGGRSEGAAADELRRELERSFEVVFDGKRVRPLMDQVRAYIAGERKTIAAKIDVSWVTPFRRDVLLATAAIPRGQVASYAEIARRAGRPQAFRAVGNTMHTNPIPVVIPCHRVVASDGGLGGFGGGPEMKRYLLRLEGAELGQ